MTRSRPAEDAAYFVPIPSHRLSGVVPGVLLLALAPLVLTTGCASLSRLTATGPSATSTPVATPSEDASPEETAEAMARLEQMSAFLASRPAVRFEAEIHYDAVQPSGQKIEFGSRQRVALRRPDRVRVETQHWDADRELITFDGHRISGAIPERGVYASTEFQGTIGEAFDHLVDDYGVSSPLADLLRPDLPHDVAAHVLSARRIGTVMLAGTPCDQLAFRGARLDFQVFVQQGDEPVPRRVVIDYHADRGNPQFRAQIDGWEWPSELPDAEFHFVPPAGAQRVSFEDLLDLLLGPPVPSNPGRDESGETSP